MPVKAEGRRPSKSRSASALRLPARRRITDETDLIDDKVWVKKNAREATTWIEELDWINNLAGGKKKGIRLCVDLSATRWTKSFPWVVSDFGLLDDGSEQFAEETAKVCEGPFELVLFKVRESQG